MTKLFKTLVISLFILCILTLSTSDAATGEESVVRPVADVAIGSNGIGFTPVIEYDRLLLNVSGPDGDVVSKIFDSGVAPYLGLSGDNGMYLADGSYTYELRVLPAPDSNAQTPEDIDVERPYQRTLTQTGYFQVLDGAVVVPAMPEKISSPLGFDPSIHNCFEELITDSFCVGEDCTCSHIFGTDTIELKEENIRIFFNDTSAGEPDNDWRIIINDDGAPGTGEYFAIQDATANPSQNILVLEAGAPANQVYATANGRLGIGTSTPAAAIELETTGRAANVFVTRTDGRDANNGASQTQSVFASGLSYGFIGTKSYNQFRLLSNDLPRMTITADGDVGIGVTDVDSGNRLEVDNGATLTNAGVWTNASSRAFKENIKSLSADEAMAALAGLNPVRYTYKKEKDEEYVGFIAEDVPEMVATKDRKGLAAMDVVAVLTKVLKEQQTLLNEQQTLLKEQQTSIAELKKKIAALEKK